MNATAAQAPWWTAPPVLEHHQGVRVVREDLCEGGAKMRFLPAVLLPSGRQELVYGSPFCGGAAVALSVWSRRTGTPVTLFYAKRKALHRRQLAALRNGARIVEVPAGYMTVVQARARTHAAAHGARHLPLGFDTPEASAAFVRFLRSVRPALGELDELWCATGSGMLARCLGEAYPDLRVHGVVVGLRSRNEAQRFPPNVTPHAVAYRFEQESRAAAPFPCCPNYDRKAWELCRREARGRAGFWNVLG